MVIENTFSEEVIMGSLHIKDILIQFEGNDLSKYGLFPLFAWYLMDYVELPQRFRLFLILSG